MSHENEYIVEVETDVLYDEDEVVVFLSIDGNDFYFPVEMARKLLDLFTLRVEFAESVETDPPCGGFDA